SRCWARSSWPGQPIAEPARAAAGRRWSALRPVPGGEDNLARHIGGDAELLGYLGRPEPLLVVNEREPFLPRRPRAGGRGGGGGALCGARGAGRGGAPRGRGGGGRGPRPRGGRAEGPPPLVAVLAAGQVLAGALIQDHEFLGRLVHPHGDHGQALGVFLLALRGHAVVVLPRSFGMQFGPARNALRHYLFSKLNHNHS